MATSQVPDQPPVNPGAAPGASNRSGNGPGGNDPTIADPIPRVLSVTVSKPLNAYLRRHAVQERRPLSWAVEELIRAGIAAKALPAVGDEDDVVRIGRI